MSPVFRLGLNRHLPTTSHSQIPLTTEVQLYQVSTLDNNTSLLIYHLKNSRSLQFSMRWSTILTKLIWANPRMQCHHAVVKTSPHCLISPRGSDIITRQRHKSVNKDFPSLAFSMLGWLRPIDNGYTYFSRRQNTVRFPRVRRMRSRYPSILKISICLLNMKARNIPNSLLGKTRNSASIRLMDKLNISCTKASSKHLIKTGSLDILISEKELNTPVYYITSSFAANPCLNFSRNQLSFYWFAMSPQSSQSTR